MAKVEMSVANLSEDQAKVYNALPAEGGFREQYLLLLPKASVLDNGKDRKINAINNRIAIMQNIRLAFEQEESRLYNVVKSLENGQDPNEIDLRRQLSPPTLDGAILRFTRKGDSEE